MRKFKANYTGDVFTEVFSDEKGTLLEYENGHRSFYTIAWMRGYFTEIKEPVKLVVWKNVWRRKDGSYFLGCDWPDEKSAKLDSNDSCATIEYIKTVKFEHTIEGE